LPDPQLITAIQDLPVNTDDAYSFRRDSDTQILAGVMQEFPRAGKRRLRAEQRLMPRSVRRDASLAWLELWRHD
jgi:cobalt-zinc-cadmium efflux system outer membrane protein